MAKTGEEKKPKFEAVKKRNQALDNGSILLGCVRTVYVSGKRILSIVDANPDLSSVYDADELAEIKLMAEKIRPIIVEFESLHKELAGLV
jgi:hypothetical protein